MGEWADGLEESISVELISVLIVVLAMGVALAGLILTSNRGLRQDMRQDMTRMESRLDGSIRALESRFDAMESQFGELRERMAHLEGLLEDMREAIPTRARAS